MPVIINNEIETQLASSVGIDPLIAFGGIIITMGGIGWMLGPPIFGVLGGRMLMSRSGWTKKDIMSVSIV